MGKRWKAAFTTKDQTYELFDRAVNRYALRLVNEGRKRYPNPRDVAFREQVLLRSQELLFIEPQSGPEYDLLQVFDVYYKLVQRPRRC